MKLLCYQYKGTYKNLLIWSYKTIGRCNWKLLSFKWGLTKRCLCSHEPTLNAELISPKPKKLKYLLSFKPVKLLNKMVYVYELKLLQKRKLSQLQICYLFSINWNMTWWKKILKLLQVTIPIILIQLVYEQMQLLPYAYGIHLSVWNYTGSS